MAKEIRYLSCWIEVVPALLISKTKVPISTTLETIYEDEKEAEEYDQDSLNISPFIVQIDLKRMSDIIN